MKQRHSSGFVWVKAPEDVLVPAIHAYGQRVLRATFAVAEYMAQVIANYARRNVKWQDRTGNARSALHAIAAAGWGELSAFSGPVQADVASLVDVAGNLVVIFLSHGMSYGKYLETIQAGKFAIVMPALQAHYGQVMAMLKQVLGGR